MGLISPLRTQGTFLDVHVFPNAYMPTGTIASNLESRWLVNTQSATAVTGGTLRYSLIYIPAGKTITNINFVAGGTVPTASSHFWVALYNPSLSLMAQSTDDTSGTPLTADTVKTCALSAAQTTTVSGMHAIAILNTVSSGNTLTAYGATGNLNVPIARAVQINGAADAGLTTTAPPTMTATGVINQTYWYWLT